MPRAATGTYRLFICSRGPFDHCSATAKYRSGTQISLIAYATGNWNLQFYKREWQQRKRQNFPARLIVDGRTVFRGNGYFKGRSAFVYLGRSGKRVSALMRGRVMTVETSSGTSSFRLDGTFKAATLVSQCWKRHRRNGRNNGVVANNRGNRGAFGGNTGQGAFGGNPGAFGSGPANNSQARVLARAATLELATTFLSKFKRPYSIMSRNQNVLKSFPVNWRFDNGLIGGMKVYRNTSTSAENCSVTADRPADGELQGAQRN